MTKSVEDQIYAYMKTLPRGVFYSKEEIAHAAKVWPRSVQQRFTDLIKKKKIGRILVKNAGKQNFYAYCNRYEDGDTVGAGKLGEQHSHKHLEMVDGPDPYVPIPSKDLRKKAYLEGERVELESKLTKLLEDFSKTFPGVKTLGRVDITESEVGGGIGIKIDFVTRGGGNG